MKAEVKETGDIIYVGYDAIPRCWRNADNPYRGYHEKELSFLEEMEIVWNERLYETAKSVLNAIMSNSRYNAYGIPPEELADDAVRYARALINRLGEEKRENNENNN